MKSSLTVYKASAGSGKTFTLAIQYIKTLIEQESRRAYSHILAVTFTNKATAEMKDRILQQLYGIWKGLPSSANYLESLQKNSGRTASSCRRRRFAAVPARPYAISCTTITVSGWKPSTLSSSRS